MTVTEVSLVVPSRADFHHKMPLFRRAQRRIKPSWSRTNSDPSIAQLNSSRVPSCSHRSCRPFLITFSSLKFHRKWRFATAVPPPPRLLHPSVRSSALPHVNLSSSSQRTYVINNSASRSALENISRYMELG